jgi:FkbM family methyltransferase
MNPKMSLSAKARKLAVLMGRHRWRAALRHGVAATVEHRAALWDRAVASVVDVGANKGQFALFAREAFPRALIYSFEPLPRPCRTFRRVFAGDSGVRLFPRALAPEAGRRTIHVSRDGASSSLLPIGARQEAVFPGTGPAGEATIETAPLDACLAAEEIARPALLKLDVQGFELEALRGCGALLEHFDVVYCECSFVELYAGQALHAEVADVLAAAGFVEAGRFNETVHPRLGPVQADCLFLRQDA